MRRSIILTIMMMLLCISLVSATITHTLTAPAALAEQTSTSMIFNWTVVTDDATAPAGMTTWIYLSAVNNDTTVLNTSATVTNATWHNETVTSMGVGFYKWNLITNDSDGNTSSTSRYFEIRDATNESDFRWESDDGFEAMTLDSDTGDLTVMGSVVLNSTSGGILDSPTDTYLRVGDAGVSNQGLVANDDLFIAGKLEINGVTFIDTTSTISGNMRVVDGTYVFYGTSSDAIFGYNTQQTPDSLITGLGTDNNGWIITETADYATDYGAPLMSDPTIWLQSADETSTDDWLSMQHDQTDARATAGQGDLRLSAAENVNIDRNLTMGDDTNYLLFDIVSNGTDVTLTSSQSLDIYIDSSGGNLRVPTATNITWDNGGSIWVNSTCVVITSPGGTGSYAVCD